MSHTGATESRSVLHRQRVRHLIASSARMALGYDGRLTEQVVADIARQCGIQLSALRAYFPSNDDLLDAVHDLLVSECVERVTAAVASFRNSPTPTVAGAARALGAARPIERTGLLIRTERRARALSSPGASDAVLRAEKAFGAALTGQLQRLVAPLGRRFSWPDALATRVLIDSFERSFAGWILAGEEESTFERSPYVSRTLPRLLIEVTGPAEGPE